MSNYYDSNSKGRFYPVQCTQEYLDNLADSNKIEGRVFFVTDKKKLYLGKDGQKIPMCASSGIFFGNKAIHYENDGKKPNPFTVFYYNEIEGNDIPEKDDLILNIGSDTVDDGCFYRVDRITDDGIETSRITMQGGGGGFVSGGTGSGSSVDFAVDISGSSKLYFSKDGDEAYIGIIPRSQGDPSNRINEVFCSYSKDPDETDAIFATIEVGPTEGIMNNVYRINLIDYLKDFYNDTPTTIYVHVKDLYDTRRSVSFVITAVSLTVTTEEPSLIKAAEDSIEYRVTSSGSRTLDSYRYRFDFYKPGESTVFRTLYQPIEKTDIGQRNTCVLNLSEIPHGDYTVKVVLTATKGNLSGELTSNELAHNIIRYADGDPILGVLIPEKIEQYMNIPIDYLLVYGNNTKAYPLTITLDNEVIATEQIRSGTLESYNLIIDKKGIYRLRFVIDPLNISKEYELRVEEYKGALPVINIDNPDLKSYLTPRGRTNNALDKETWPDKKNSARKGKLEGFHYHGVNGWLLDENNVNYLKVSSGASVTYDAYSPLQTNSGKGPNDIGATIELDFMLTGITKYTTPLMTCLSKNADQTIKTGFAVYGDCFVYYLGGQEVVKLNLVQDKRIHLAFVIDQTDKLCYTYLNGIVSNIFKFDEDDDFGNSPRYPAYLDVSSSAGQINIYGIRFYSGALKSSTVLNNYQAGLDADSRLESYQSNQIKHINDYIDLDMVSAPNYNITIPYVKIVGGYGMFKDVDGNMIMKSKSNANVPALPVRKDDFRAIDISIHYPKYDPDTKRNSYFKNYSDYSITSEFENGGSVLDSFDKKMTKGAWMYCQGTSSMEYPVKNLRVKTTGGPKFTVQPGIAPVKLVCFKADFMESSGSHNTGAANFMDNVAYNRMSLKTPGQKQFPNETIVTCIKGHPCVIFWSETGEPGTFRYIGKYNFNLDKGTPEPFGFKEDPKNPKFGYLTNEANELVLDENGKKQNSIYCYEFLDNNESVCNFIHDTESTYTRYSVEDDPETTVYEINDKTEQERYYDSWYSDRINEDGDIVPGWRRGFGSRHPEDKEDYHDADVLFELASWLNDLYDLRFNKKQVNNANTKFKNEYWKYLDKDFTLAYYVLTEALLMADSRVKNMMIATWGKEWRYLLNDGSITSVKPTDESKIKESSFGFIWYPIFYDMDTMLGLDNIGYRNKNYYDEDDVEDVFNGDEVLWKFVRDSLQNDVGAFYRQMEKQSVLKAEEILPCFNDNQATLANETFYNEDALYKYINPYLAHHSGARLFPAQGDRALDREFFVHNRIKYLAGKYNSNDHQEHDRFFCRITAPKDTGDQETDPKVKLLNASVRGVTPSNQFELTSARTCYAGVKVGTTANRYKFNGEEEKTISVTIDKASGTEIYITGVSNLISFGDLSNKYPYGIDFNAMKDSRIKQILIGNAHKDYYNPYLETEDAMDPSILQYLEEFNLQNCRAFSKGINFRSKPAQYDNAGKVVIEGTPGCNQIKIINLIGSSATSVTLPIGGVIQELRLPTTITTLNIDSHQELTADGFTIGHYDYTNNRYVNDFTKLNHIKIKDTPIDSYSVLKSALFTLNETNLEDYYVENFNWVLDDTDDFEFDNNNKIIGIKVLDKLLTLNPGSSDGLHSSSLIGNLTINLPSNSITINEYEIYHKYLNTYPNVAITYSDETRNNDNFIEAYQIKFYRLNATDLADNTDITTKEYYYYALSDGEDSLSEIISHPDFNNPLKADTLDETYEFEGLWIDWNTKQKYVQSGFTAPNGNYKSFSDSYPSSNMDLVPYYKVDSKLYVINFYDYDGTYLTNCKGEYETSVGAACAAPEYKYVYRPDDNTLGEHQRYTFKGWKSAKDYDMNTANPELYDLSNMKFNQENLKMYAHYVVEDARRVATNADYFKFENGVITLKDGFADILKGKITLPFKEGCTHIGNFSGFGTDNNLQPLPIGGRSNLQITHLYIPDASKYTHIDSYAFAACKSLVKVYIEGSALKAIGDYGFARCCNLSSITLPNSVTSIGVHAFAGEGNTVGYQMTLALSELPASLETLGNQAFYYGGPNIRISRLPTNVSEIGSSCFAYCNNVTVCELPDQTKPSTVGHMAFYLCDYEGLSQKITIGSNWRRASQTSTNIFGDMNMDAKSYIGVTEVRVSSSFADSCTGEGDLNDRILNVLFDSAQRQKLTNIDVEVSQ